MFNLSLKRTASPPAAAHTFDLVKLAWVTILLSVSATAAGNGSWTRLPAVAMWDAQKIGHKNIHQVQPAKRDDAIAKLSQSGVFGIRDHELSTWAGSTAKCSLGTRPFLLRSVSNGSDAKTLEIRMQGADTLVSNGALGRNIELRNMPIVACLPKKPDELYVVYSLAE
jgi:hypothetical protein